MVENRISPCINADRKQYPQYANPHTTAFEKTGKMKANMNGANAMQPILTGLT